MEFEKTMEIDLNGLLLLGINKRVNAAITEIKNSTIDIKKIDIEILKIDKESLKQYSGGGTTIKSYIMANNLSDKIDYILQTVEQTD